ncbi:MAG TPA: TadA family conjugal transfer-associated ATPase [Jatrophihabitans sp.]|nr:TadA family conjugal transfer-associated ATPase [Jatrophihabitans sp.]
MSANLVDRVRLRLAGSVGEPAHSVLAEAAGQESELLLDSAALAELSGRLRAELTGAGPLEPLLAEPEVTDVLVNAPDQVWVDRGRGLERSAVWFGSDAEVRRLAARLAAQAGRRLDDAAPFVDAALPDGIRLHAILPPLVAHPTLSLRVLGRRRLSLTDLLILGALTADLAELLTAVITARLSLLISGGTGTGKTSLLAALLATAQPTDRIVTIEDAAELSIDHPHVVALLARPANIEGAGAIELAELVRQALRMRADRLVVGEFRGAEIVELLAALNTGHAGGAATVHANSVTDVPARLVALAALAGMPATTLAAQAASALDVLVHIRRDRDGIRRIEQLALWPRDDDRPTPRLVWTRGAGVGPAAKQLRDRLALAGVEVPTMLAQP